MNQLFAGIDGMVPRGVIASTGCCVPSICDVDVCSLSSGFIGLLPKGPLWDRPKYEAIMIMQKTGECSICWDCDHCPTMVDYAVLVGQRLGNVIQNALWPALRESDPFTAYSSTNDWLERFAWEDCFRGNCRAPSLGDLTPIEYEGECGPTQVDIRYTPTYRRSLESAIIKSLERMQMGVIKNLASINFVIEPLKARFVPADDIDACTSDTICLTVEKTSDFFDGVSDTSCGSADPVAAYIDRDIMQLPPELPEYIWPGHMAAECIVRSLLSHNGKLCVIRSNQTPD